MTSVLPAVAPDLNRMSVDSSQDGMPTQEPTPPHNIKQEDEPERGRPRSRTADKGSSGNVSDKDRGEGDGDGANGSNSDGPARKRRRSRKGQDKKFACPTKDCGKSYSRAEHLYRHQLNHNPKQMYDCDFPGCARSFVRLDLCNRHKDRHAAKGSTLNKKNSMISHASPVVDGRLPFAPPGSISPEANRPGTGYNKMAQSHLPYHSPKGMAGSPFTPLTNTPPTGYPVGHQTNGVDYSDPAYAHLHGQRPPAAYQSPSGPARPVVQTNVGQYEAMSPVSAQHGFNAQSHASTPTQHSAGAYVPPQNFPPFSLPPSDFSQGPGAATARETPQSYAPTNSGDYHGHAQSQQGAEMMMLDQMAMPHTMPIFGSDSILQKSPYVGMPEDFMAYLFNTQSGDGSPIVQVSQAPYPQCGNVQTEYGVPYYGTEPAQMGYFPTSGPQQVMAVNNLLDQNLPETILSEEKSTEIFEYIKERFQENGHTPIEQQKDVIMEGDRTDDAHMLSRKMMQAYIGSYWLHFSDQVPVLHKPTFSPDRTPIKLLIAMMTIGASCLDKAHGKKVTAAGATLSNFLAWHLRWELFMDPKSRPPAKLWVFQTLLLLELYEKMYSTRELHERAHIHHATTITLMRRGRSLIGKSSLDSPPNLRGDRDNSSRHSSMSGPAHTADEWWNHWITNESTRRVAFAAFVIDSIHATMFGHSTVMVAHEMRLPLPCDESLWRATSGAEVGRLEANMLSNGTKAMSFLEALKRTLSGQQVQTNSFGRTILMAGLLSVSWHMHQRDVQVLSLGGGVVQAFGGRDKWRSTLTRAFDIWKGDFDKSLNRGEMAGAGGDPYSFTGAGTPSRTEANVVFESRIVLHHLAHMAMHVDIVECQIFARAKRLLGRAIGTQDLNSTQRKMRDVWAPSAMARDAAYYALKFLASVLVQEDTAGTSPSSSHSYGDTVEEPYSARDDVLLNRPWVLYFACLVIWCYGYALEGPCPDVPAPATRGEQIKHMRSYLRRFAAVSSPDDLKGKRGLNENSALLMVLRETFRQTRWELLNEGATLLGNCIELNAGGTV